MPVTLRRLRCSQTPIGPNSDLIYFSGVCSGLAAGTNYRTRLYTKATVTNEDGTTSENWYIVCDTEIPGFATLFSGFFIAGDVSFADIPFRLNSYPLRVHVYIDKGSHTLAADADIEATALETTAIDPIPQMVGDEEQPFKHFSDAKWAIGTGAVIGPDTDSDSDVDRLSFDVLTKGLRQSSLPSKLHSAKLRLSIENRQVVGGIERSRWIPMFDIPLVDYKTLGNDYIPYTPKLGTKDTFVIQFGGTAPETNTATLFWPDKRRRYEIKVDLVMTDANGVTVAQHAQSDFIRVPPLRVAKAGGTNAQDRV